jgi:hypothetical protein
MNIVTDDELEALKCVTAENPSYSLHTRSTIACQVDDLYENEKVKMKKFLVDLPHVALTADYWNAIANDTIASCSWPW